MYSDVKMRMPGDEFGGFGECRTRDHHTGRTDCALFERNEGCTIHRVAQSKIVSVNNQKL
jgi:hypothetical protein